MSVKDMKKWIDEASYEELLRRWRFAPVGDLLFVLATGDYFSEVMAEKKKHVDAAAVSKRVGFDR